VPEPGRQHYVVERVVVVGAGFAGLAATKRLAGRGLAVTLVDRHNFHTFQPLLYQVATAGLEPADIAYPVRTVFGRQADVTFRHGSVDNVDVDRRIVILAGGDELEYDHLVVATGAAAQFFGIAGAAEHALPLSSLGDARRLRNHLLATLERADAHPEAYDGGAPVFVVVGAGPTGVETAGALVELLEACIRRDRLRIDPTRSRVVLVDGGSRLLPSFAPTAGHYAEATLSARGVEIRVDSPVTAVTSDGVTLADGTFLRASLVVWAAGVTVEGTLAATLPFERRRGGRVAVEPDLSVSGHPEVSAVGDAAFVPLGAGLGPCPQLAQVAIQSGTHAASQILLRVAGLQTEAFEYHDKGLMATVGRRAAIAQLRRGPVIRGTFGWLAWLGLHLVYLIGYRNRLIVLVNWFWRYVDWPSGPRLIVADAESEP
jgi:NADH:quinone reductase (non-electrogenic)